MHCDQNGEGQPTQAGVSGATFGMGAANVGQTPWGGMPSTGSFPYAGTCDAGRSAAVYALWRIWYASRDWLAVS